MLDDRGVVIEDLIGVRFGAPSGRHALGGKQIFCSVWNAVQWAAVVAASDFLLRGFGLLEGEFRREASISVEARPKFFGAVEKVFGEVDRRKLLGLNAGCEFGDRKEVEFLRGGRHSCGLSSWVWERQALEQLAPAWRLKWLRDSSERVSFRAP